MDDVTKFPLAWPPHKPRTPDSARTWSQFRVDGSPPSLARGRRQLRFELGRMGVREYILSTNIALRLDGEPRSGQPRPADPGVAVYFTLAGKPTVLAVDKWETVGENLRAIVKHVEALRGIERWGVATAEQMFLGNVALPAPGQHSARTWRSVLNFGASSVIEVDEVRSRYRELAKQALGDEAALRELNVARDEALEELSR